MESHTDCGCGAEGGHADSSIQSLCTFSHTPFAWEKLNFYAFGISYVPGPLCVGCSMDLRCSNPSPCSLRSFSTKWIFPPRMLHSCSFPSSPTRWITGGLSIKRPSSLGLGGRVPFILQEPQGKPTCPSQVWRNLREDE